MSLAFLDALGDISQPQLALDPILVKLRDCGPAFENRTILEYIEYHDITQLEFVFVVVFMLGMVQVHLLLCRRASIPGCLQVSITLADNSI